MPFGLNPESGFEHEPIINDDGVAFINGIGMWLCSLRGNRWKIQALDPLVKFAFHAQRLSYRRDEFLRRESRRVTSMGESASLRERRHLPLENGRQHFRGGFIRDIRRVLPRIVWDQREEGERFK
jgi:hypothetical protein